MQIIMFANVERKNAKFKSKRDYNAKFKSKNSKVKKSTIAVRLESKKKNNRKQIGRAHV